MSEFENKAMREEEFPSDLLTLPIQDLEITSPASHGDVKPDINGLLQEKLATLHEGAMLVDDDISSSDRITLDQSLHTAMTSATTLGTSPPTFVGELTQDALNNPQFSLNDILLLQTYLSTHSASTYSTPFGTPQSTPAVTPANTPAHTPGHTPSVSPCSSLPTSPRGGVDPLSYGVTPGALIPKLEANSSMKQKVPRHKRKSHIDAEHRRRNKIQGAFDEIQKMVPSLAEASSTSKDSKCNVLNKTVEYCRELRGENKDLQRQTDQLRAEIEALTKDIKEYQMNLPATGIASASKPSSAKPEQMFQEYMLSQTRQNWKFWLFGLLVRPLFQSYNHVVNTGTTEEFCSSVLTWVEENLSLVSLRPAVFDSLRLVSTKTSVMTSPERLPSEALQLALCADLPTSSHSSAPTTAS